MTDSDPKWPEAAALIGDVEEIARQAGAAIMHYYNGGADADISIKQDGSEVTAADLASEAIILPALAKLTPGIPIVSEERVAAGETPDVSGGTFWTVDPLDGTKEFIKRTGAFVVAIGLVVDNKPVLGVIYHPAMDVMYSGAGVGTATKVDANGTRTPLLTVAQKKDAALRVLVNEPHSDMKKVKGYLSQQFGDAARIDSTSGILRACQVAEGLADLAVYENAKHDGRTSWWDIAPGHALIEAAGGRIERHDAAPMLYKDADYRVPPHTAYAPHYKKKPAAPDNNATP